MMLVACCLILAAPEIQNNPYFCKMSLKLNTFATLLGDLKRSKYKCQIIKWAM